MNDGRSAADDLRRAFAGLSENARPRADCPPAEAIWDALGGAGTAEETAAIVAHTAECFACAEAWRLGVQFAGGPSAGAQTPGAGAGAGASLGSGFLRDRRILLGIGLAAAVLVAVVGLRMLRPQAPDEMLRAPDEATITSLVPDSATLPRAACTLKWTAPAPDARYKVRVGTEDLSPVASAADLHDAAYTVPMDMLKPLAAGTVLVWQVEATLANGRRIDSPAFKNRLE
jgi:hypothetical protein